MKGPQEDERFEGVDAPGIRAMIKDYKVDMRRSAYIPMLLLLAACGKPSRPRPSLSSPPRQQNSVVDQKKQSSQGTIHAGDFLPSPENCGMIHSSRPVYPKEAKEAHIQCVVKVEYVITKTGEVRDLHAISGNPVLIPAAIAAATKWRFAPCRLFGSEPIELKSQSDIQFTLAQ